MAASKEWAVASIDTAMSEEDALLLRSLGATGAATDPEWVVAPESDSDGDIVLDDQESMTSSSSAGPPSLNVSDDEVDAEKGQASGSADALILEGDHSAEGDPVWESRAQTSTHFPRGEQMPEYTQVLVLNVYWAVRRLSSQEQKQVSKSLMGTAGATSVSYVLQVCAALLGFSAARVQRIVESVKRNDWQPCLPRQAPGHEPHGREPGDRESVGDAAVLHTLTRAALSVRAAHGSAREFPRYIARLAMEGVEVGNNTIPQSITGTSNFWLHVWGRGWKLGSLPSLWLTLGFAATSRC